MSGLITKYKRFKKRITQIDELVRRVDLLQQSVGRIESRQLLPGTNRKKTIEEYEFKVYSQWGEDGIIQYLINQIEVPNKIFVEFGVQDYKESNTRFLLQHNNWSGLVIDASQEGVDLIQKDELYFRNNLRAICAFIDKENINGLISGNGVRGDIGLLSIDIDGNDYWIWEAIECISPRIVVCEYDSLFGYRHAVTTPYDKHFDRAKAHYSFLYGGASLAAMCLLGKKKGYSLVGSNSTGLNAFFVRNDVLGSLPALTPSEAYRKAQFRNSKDRTGTLTYIGFEESLKLIGDMPLFDLERNSLIKVREL